VVKTKRPFLAPRSNTHQAGFRAGADGFYFDPALAVALCRVERPLRLNEALFTAVSALTVTGLSVITPGEDLSLFGQLVLLSLNSDWRRGLHGCFGDHLSPAWAQYFIC
jgi:hypothetical protein